jgi:hypothetical protein
MGAKNNTIAKALTVGELRRFIRDIHDGTPVLLEVGWPDSVAVGSLRLVMPQSQAGANGHVNVNCLYLHADAGG